MRTLMMIYLHSQVHCEVFFNFFILCCCEALSVYLLIFNDFSLFLTVDITSLETGMSLHALHG